MPAEAMAVEEIEGAMDEMAADAKRSGEDADARDDEALAAALEDPDRYRICPNGCKCLIGNQEKLLRRARWAEV